MERIYPKVAAIQASQEGHHSKKEVVKLYFFESLIVFSSCTSSVLSLTAKQMMPKQIQESNSNHYKVFFLCYFSHAIVLSCHFTYLGIVLGLIYYIVCCFKVFYKTYIHDMYYVTFFPLSYIRCDLLAL